MIRFGFMRNRNIGNLAGFIGMLSKNLLQTAGIESMRLWRALTFYNSVSVQKIFLDSHSTYGFCWTEPHLNHFIPAHASLEMERRSKHSRQRSLSESQW